MEWGEYFSRCRDCCVLKGTPRHSSGNDRFTLSACSRNEVLTCHWKSILFFTRIFFFCIFKGKMFAQVAMRASKRTRNPLQTAPMLTQPRLFTTSAWTLSRARRPSASTSASASPTRVVTRRPSRQLRCAVMASREVAVASAKSSSCWAWIRSVKR